MPSFLDHISVHGKLALSPQSSPQGRIARDRMEMVVWLEAVRVRLRRQTLDFDRISLSDEYVYNLWLKSWH